MADDSYKTIKQIAEGYYTEKRSRFISYAIPVRTVEEVKEQLEKYRKQYYDARHVCWAYMLGPERQTFRANDDGEPSSTHCLIICIGFFIFSYLLYLTLLSRTEP